MRTRKSVAIVVALLIVGGIVAALQMSAAQDTGDVTRRTAVAAVASESVTEYEPDPFEPERLRSSTVRVRRMAIVYSDGSVEVRRVD
ncbi:MAG: hypothetical protein ACOX9R_08885 [Armatimonadota bacterium]